MASPSVQRLLWRQVTRSTPTPTPTSSSSLSSPCLKHIFPRRTITTTTTTTRTPFTARARNAQSQSQSRQQQQHQQHRAYSTPPPPPPPNNSRNQVKFWPFALVIAAGTGGYVLLAKKRAGVTMSNNNNKNAEAGTPPQQQQLPAPDKPTPAFSPDDVTVVFVLGGPGAGKGTQCARLVADYGFTHLSAGDLLRAEQERPGSQFGALIRDYIKNGQIVPMEVTIQLLENAMAAALLEEGNGDQKGNGKKKKGKFLIDGFPRKHDQALRFEAAVCPARLVLFFDCPEAEMERRLLERGKTSGRADDNADSIRKRFRTFVDTSMPVVQYYDALGKVLRVDATPEPDRVYAAAQKLLADRLGDDLRRA